MNRMRIANVLALSSLALVLVTCSSDSDNRQPRSYPGGDADRGGAYARPGAGDGLDMIPPSEWWKDPKISVAVTLTADQIASLDRIDKEQSEEIAHLERDTMIAVRDVRQAADATQPSVEDITGAGQRLRGIRDALFDRRVQMFAAERTLLTQTQWQALQQAVAARNRSDQNNRGNYGRGGRGGMGGRGRFPG
jgi:hypothetical protein